MLVLTRKPGERVLIGDDIVVVVLDVRGDGIRLGFEAPRGVKIQREEVLAAVAAQNLAAAQSGATDAESIARALGLERAAAGADQEESAAAIDEPMKATPPSRD